jgi:hypothetical protein
VPLTVFTAATAAVCAVVTRVSWDFAAAWRTAWSERNELPPTTGVTMSAAMSSARATVVSYGVVVGAIGDAVVVGAGAGVVAGGGAVLHA